MRLPKTELMQAVTGNKEYSNDGLSSCLRVLLDQFLKVVPSFWVRCSDD